MQQIKIAFFDIDGTLVKLHAGEMTPPTRQALAALRQNGVRVCLATGRSPLTLPPFPGVTFDAYLTFNGSYCYDAQQVLFSNPIPQADVRRLVENAAAIGRPVSLATKDRLAANGSDADLADYFRIAGREVEVADDFDRLLQQPVYQLMMGCREPEYAAVLQGVRHAKIAAWWDRAVDIIPADGGKGVAIEKLLAHYGLDRAQAIAFGDGNNDIEMLQAVGTGVAMANASARLKAVADDVCGDVAEDGVYHYCRVHGLI